MEQDSYFFEYFGELDYINHTSDNSIFMCSKKYEYDKFLEQNGYIFMGFSLRYNYKQRQEEELAFVFQDEDGEVQWIHFPIICLHTLLPNPSHDEEEREYINHFLWSLGYKKNDSSTCKILHYDE